MSNRASCNASAASNSTYSTSEKTKLGRPGIALNPKSPQKRVRSLRE